MGAKTYETIAGTFEIFWPTKKANKKSYIK
jgi:hypothetical protein